jgi:hypothetical protein
VTSRDNSTNGQIATAFGLAMTRVKKRLRNDEGKKGGFAMTRKKGGLAPKNVIARNVVTKQSVPVRILAQVY